MRPTGLFLWHVWPRLYNQFLVIFFSSGLIKKVRSADAYFHLKVKQVFLSFIFSNSRTFQCLPLTVSLQKKETIFTENENTVKLYSFFSSWSHVKLNRYRHWKVSLKSQNNSQKLLFVQQAYLVKTTNKFRFNKNTFDCLWMLTLQLQVLDWMVE